MRRRLLAVLVSVALAGVLALTGCAEVEEKSEEGYQPASLSEPDSTGVKTVTLTEGAGKRIGLRTAPVAQVGPHLAIPYEALIYDGEGAPWVYTEVSPLSYRRVNIVVVSVDGQRALLTSGPPVGTPVVTQGATEVFGAELEMAGKH